MLLHRDVRLGDVLVTPRALGSGHSLQGRGGGNSDAAVIAQLISMTRKGNTGA